MEFYKTAHKYLQACEIKVSNDFIRMRMESHPDYPSLVSFTDTLDELGLIYAAVIADKEQYGQLTFPLLAYMEKKEGKDFFIVHSADEMLVNDRSLLKQWNGVALIVQTNAKVTSSDHQDFLIREKKENVILLGSALVALLILLGTVVIPLSITGLTLMVFATAGMCICSLIILHKMGRSNALTDQFCSADANSGCDKVLKPEKQMAGTVFTLGDIGFIYFFGVSLFIAISSLAGLLTDSLRLLQIPFALGLPVIAISVWYQWRILKSWCRLCLATMAVVLLQVFVLLASSSFVVEPISFNGNSIAVFVCSFLSAAILELNFVSLVRRSNDTITNTISLLKWKRDPVVFLSLLYKQPRISVVPWRDDMIIGNPQAPLQILVGCNPYCNPCAIAHKHLEELADTYPNLLGITVRFVLMGEKTTTRKGMAATHIFHAFFKTRKEDVHRRGDFINDWFNMMDLPTYMEKYGAIPIGEDYSDLLMRHQKWTAQTDIENTPTLFINGYKLPRKYAIPDIKSLIVHLNEYIGKASFVNMDENNFDMANHLEPKHDSR